MAPVIPRTALVHSAAARHDRIDRLRARLGAVISAREPELVLAVTPAVGPTGRIDRLAACNRSRVLERAIPGYPACPWSSVPGRVVHFARLFRGEIFSRRRT